MKYVEIAYIVVGIFCIFVLISFVCVDTYYRHKREAEALSQMRDRWKDSPTGVR